jgi:probable rRNA maturation factor
MVEVNNLTTTSVDKKFLEEVGQKVLEKEGKEGKDLSIALVGQKKIRELNKNYRKKDKATDVLSFEYDSLGEIIICPEVVRKNAKEFNSTFKKELTRVLIHGILHLLGYDHNKNITEAKKIIQKEKYYLSYLKF